MHDLGKIHHWPIMSLTDVLRPRRLMCLQSSCQKPTTFPIPLLSCWATPVPSKLLPSKFAGLCSAKPSGSSMQTRQPSNEARCRPTSKTPTHPGTRQPDESHCVRGHPGVKHRSPVRLGAILKAAQRDLIALATSSKSVGSVSRLKLTHQPPPEDPPGQQ